MFSSKMKSVFIASTKELASIEVVLMIELPENFRDEMS